MIRILANDGIHPDGKLLLEEANFEVDTQKIPQENLAKALQNYDVLLVRSATKVRKELIDQIPNIKMIGRGGVGLDNIDVEYARSKGIIVFNTPAASSKAVAELAIAHIFTIMRSLHQSNREMAGMDFKELKSKLGKKGVQISGKTLGIIGFGRIGQEVAKIALALGMRIRPVDSFVEKAEVRFDISENENISLNIQLHTQTLNEVISKCDIFTVHVPFSGEKPLIGAEELARMKKGVVIINTARGGVVDEDALLDALNSGHVAAAGLDVFKNEPNPRAELLNHPNVSASPHIGAETAEAQSYIGMELAERIIEHYSEGN